MVKLVFNNGTETGYTQTAAEIIQKEFGGDSLVALHDISQTEPSDFNDCSYTSSVVYLEYWAVAKRLVRLL